jgi:hypothetical protein
MHECTLDYNNGLGPFTVGTTTLDGRILRKLQRCACMRHCDHQMPGSHLEAHSGSSNTCLDDSHTEEGVQEPSDERQIVCV